MKMPSVCTVKVLAIQFAMSVKAKQPYNQGSCFELTDTFTYL